jgi:hypothetical protein
MAGVVFGQTRTGRINRDPYCFAALNSAVGATLIDGSKLICKAGGTAWFVAPESTQIGSAWANGQYNFSQLGDKCCISEWGTLGSLLSSTIFNYVATEWFVPSRDQLANPGYLCRTNWDSFCSVNYWSSFEISPNNAGRVCFANGTAGYNSKTTSNCVRAFKCVMY